MKLIDLFLFSEPHETDVLWVKLNLGTEYVYEWVIVENDYTFRGEYKGYSFQRILNIDDRFQQFRDRIKYIPCSFRNDEMPACQEGIFDEIAFKIEEAQRNVARSYLLETYQDDDYVILSDVDEGIDFSTELNRALIEEHLMGCTTFIRIPRMRFWYDFDNLWSEKRSIPVVSMKYLRVQGESLGRLRRFNVGAVPLWSEHIVFEYSYCFSREYIERKYQTFSHTGYLVSEIRKGIECNHLPVSSVRGRKLDLQPKWWFRKVRLTKINSPKFVRENIESLRTNIVPQNYKQRRKQAYPHLFRLRTRAAYHGRCLMRNVSQYVRNGPLRLTKKLLRKTQEKAGEKMNIPSRKHLH